MRSVACFVLLAIVGVVLSDPIKEDFRGCQYVLGRCVRECEEGTRAYVVNCDYKTPEATCDEPNPQPDLSGKICDFSACYCQAPTVRDEATNKCVALEDCPKKE